MLLSGRNMAKTPPHDSQGSQGPQGPDDQMTLREAKLRRLTELIRNDEYEVDADLLADAILKHLGLKPARRLSS